MADKFDQAERSRIMANIRSKDTKPEITLRKAIHRRGIRYRLHLSDLPGKPDIVLRSSKVAIQVRGCFWHLHNCIDGRIPKTRVKYWTDKLEGNVARDRANDKKLKALGWGLICIWECELSSSTKVEKTVNAIVHVLDKN